MKKFKVEVQDDKKDAELEEAQDQATDASQGQEADQVDPLEELRKESADNYDKFLRAMADMDNLKKRFAKERSELLRYAGENLARDLLDVVDNLNRAASQEISEAGLVDYKKGVELVYESFVSILGKHGINAESAIGQEFDPAKHDALVSQPTQDAEPGIVLQELKPAYYFKDKLLRPAQVVVSAKP